MSQWRLLQLMLTRGIGDVALKRALARVFSGQDSLESICSSPEKISEVLRCRPNVAEAAFTNVAQAQSVAYELDKNGVEMVSIIDERFPQQLKGVLGKQCPPVLFVKGNLSLFNKSAVGFCGSRKASSKGIYITQQCAEQLVSKGITIVSGYASGVDLAAHTSALSHGGNTIFVLAEGMLNATLKSSVRNYIADDNHLFVSQFSPHAQWNPGAAMKRNLVIIGLSNAMILVESGERGGTFAAGEDTLKVNLPLFVIDFEKPEVSAKANPYFIAQGGQPIRGKNGVPSLGKVFAAVKLPKAPAQETVQISMSI